MGITERRREDVKVLELFAGTRSIGKAFEERGHSVLIFAKNERKN